MLESAGRWEAVFSKTPPDYIYVFVRRVAFAPGRLDRKMQSMMAFAWFVWGGGAGKMEVRGIPKETQSRLEKPGDWDAAA